jgi:hypothetical protein
MGAMWKAWICNGFPGASSIEWKPIGEQRTARIEWNCKETSSSGLQRNGRNAMKKKTTLQVLSVRVSPEIRQKVESLVIHLSQRRNKILGIRDVIEEAILEKAKREEV